MEFIPEAGTSLKINGYPIEIMQVKHNMVKTVRIAVPGDGHETTGLDESTPNG